MNKITKTIIGLSISLSAALANAECVVDGEYLKSLAKKETPKEIGCDVELFVNDSSLKKYSSDRFMLMSMKDHNVEVLDLTDMDSSLMYSINMSGNTKLKEIKLGDITRISKLTFNDSKITDLTFLSDINSVRIITNTNIKKFPDEDSKFCDGAKSYKIDITGKENKAAMIEACDIEVK
ncbi:hypothetical protein [Psychromonas aquatilis]|uniref:Uncharacterized protein n=1 Tax=Psychromonas aquatilis TaxID=2005072 RepID=A0ABU9GRQ6_9GAMM